MNNEQLTRARILNETSELFQKKGVKFTMDELAAQLKMSKKTLYNYYSDKEDLFSHTIDFVFDQIMVEKKQITEQEDLELLDKTAKVLKVFPKQYEHLNFQQILTLGEKYPPLYQKILTRLENNWEMTIELLEEGKKKGLLRNFSIPIFQSMYEATIEHFLSRSVLHENKLTYQEALNEVVEIMLDGVKTK